MKRIAAEVWVSAAVIACLWVLAPAAGEERRAGETPAAETVQYGPARELAKLADTKIHESSGIACGRVNDGVFWTHNDAGNPARLYAFNRKGESLGTFVVTGAESRDWEDIASFKRGKRAFLLIADIGDNYRQRREYVLYLVAEPVLRKALQKPARLKPLMKVRFQYEDGPHNCESMGFDPVESVVYLVEKTGAPRCRVYALPMTKAESSKALVAKAVATLKIPTTTGMDVSPDGLRAVVVTYGDAYEYTRGVKEKWADAFARDPRRLPMPRRAQGESIGYGPDGKSLYLTSEKVPTPLFEVPVIGKDSAAGTKPTE